MKPSGLTMRMACWAWVQKYGDGGCGCDGVVVVVAWFGDEVEAQNLPVDGRLKKWQGACHVVQIHDCPGQMIVNLALVHMPGAIHHARAQRTNKCTEHELEPTTDRPRINS